MKNEDEYMFECCKPFGIEYMRKNVCMECFYFNYDCTGCPDRCKKVEEKIDELYK